MKMEMHEGKMILILFERFIITHTGTYSDTEIRWKIETCIIIKMFNIHVRTLFFSQVCERKKFSIQGWMVSERGSRKHQKSLRMPEKGPREPNKCMKKSAKRDTTDSCIALSMFRHGLMKFTRFVIL